MDLQTKYIETDLLHSTPTKKMHSDNSVSLRSYLQGKTIAEPILVKSDSNAANYIQINDLKIHADKSVKCKITYTQIIMFSEHTPLAWK